MKCILSALLLLLLPVLSARASNWPNWRGPDNQGHCAEKSVPRKWGPKENVRWKVPLPSTGSSTPVVWGDRVFVTQAKDKTLWPPKGNNGGPASAETRMLLCFARADGKPLWDAKVTYKNEEATHPTNPFCSASPVTDGERVIVSHGSAGLHCYDMTGKPLWNKDLGKMEHVWGNASSPILYKDLCILWVGPGKNQVLVAYDKKTGAEKWRHEEPGGASGLGEDKKWIGSWSTPLIVKIGDHDELILTVPQKVLAFNPDTGKELWSCAGMGNLVYTSPLCSKDGVVVAMSGFHGPALAVRAGGKGDVTKTHRLWHQTKSMPQRIGSGIIVDKHVYILNADGVCLCLDLETGDKVWSQRLADTWSSMVQVDDHLYINDRNANTYILKVGTKFEEPLRNNLGEHMDASLAISDGDIFIRTYKQLWCISEKKANAAPKAGAQLFPMICTGWRPALTE
jgi:outer membrane protein assembly factor BamB